ncbi:RecQ family ATP-dependent DNA helicase [Candidatus Falkowbacteria bacterium]|nr:RecQ family ATP-dependent DNA helicase [Candidatus Falkowbacteria bacterium]
MNEHKEKLLELLNIHYGFKDFRPGQAEAIDSVLSGKDTLVVMPTGGGKSLIYQLPALVMDGVTIVISPLIALMKDQVDSLARVGIPATFINSSISPDQAKERLNSIKQGEIKLLYIAPERFYNQEFVNSLSEMKVSLFAIDEAHCISQWGHDFRPSYLRLKSAIELAGRPPVIALTATATPEVKEDIIKQLELKEPNRIIKGFARPNLQFAAVRAVDRQKMDFILNTVESNPEYCGIVYTGTRSKADEIAQALLDRDIEAVAYHAGMDPESRRWVQESFLKGKTKVIVATNAFGLGIDKPDIRFVIHHDLPGTLEAYYQEAGRAGRDGQPSFCILFHSSKDRYLQEFFIKGDNPPPETILEIYDTLASQERDLLMTTYSELSEYLSDDVPDMAIGTALKILEREGYVQRTSEKVSNAYIRLNDSLDNVLASISKKAKRQLEVLAKLTDRYLAELQAGSEFNLEELAGIIEENREALVRVLNALKKADLIEYNPPKRGTEIRILKRVPVSEVGLDFKALRKKADRAYSKLDEIENYVFSPECRHKFILDYFGDPEARACGRCDNCLTGGRTLSSQERRPKKKEYKKSAFAKKKDEEYKVGEKKNILNTRLTQLETLELYNQGKSLEEIASERGLTQSTIVEHICFLVDKKLINDADKLVEADKRKKIEKMIKKIGAEKLKPIKEALGDDFSYDEIKIVRALI